MSLVLKECDNMKEEIQNIQTSTNKQRFQFIQKKKCYCNASSVEKKIDSENPKVPKAN